MVVVVVGLVVVVVIIRRLLAGAIPPMAEMQAMWWCQRLQNQVEEFYFVYRGVRPVERRLRCTMVGCLLAVELQGAREFGA